MSICRHLLPDGWLVGSVRICLGLDAFGMYIRGRFVDVHMVKGQGLWTCSPQQRQSLSVERCLCFKQGWPMRQLVTCNPCDVWPLPPYSPSFCVIGKTPVVWTQNCTSGIIDPPTQTCTFSVQHHAVPNAHMHILRTASRISQRTHAHSPYSITDFPTHTCTFSVQHHGFPNAHMHILRTALRVHRPPEPTDDTVPTRQ